MEYIVLLLKIIFFYILILFIISFFDKKKVGEFDVLDFIFYVIVSIIIILGCLNKKNFINYFVIISIFSLLKYFTNKLFFHDLKFKRLLERTPKLIIKDGKIKFKNMIDEGLTPHDLLLKLREKNVSSPNDVMYAVLEGNGKLSVFTDRHKMYPIPIIIDGVINEESLQDINKTKAWLYKVLEKKELSLDDVFYAFNKDNELYVIRKNKDF